MAYVQLRPISRAAHIAGPKIDRLASSALHPSERSPDQQIVTVGGTSIQEHTNKIAYHLRLIAMWMSFSFRGPFSRRLVGPQPRVSEVMQTSACRLVNRCVLALFKEFSFNCLEDCTSLS